jgi:zinc protease
MDGLTIAIVADKGQAVADTLVSGGPTGITYDTAGTPPEVVAEDDLIKRFPIPIEKDHVTVVPVEKMFEK